MSYGLGVGLVSFSERAKRGCRARAAVLLTLLTVAVGGMAGLVSPATASAQLSLLHAEAVAGGGVVFSCEEVSQCSGTDSCDGAFPCNEVNDNISVCGGTAAGLTFETFCCEDVSDCPRRFAGAATGCVHLAGDIKVCTWRDGATPVLNFCGAGNAPPLELVLACFDTSGSRPSLADGDCDEDGIVNRNDSEPCVPEFVFPPFDGGFGDDASVIPPTDVGVSPTDSGTSTTDSGTTARGASFNGGGGCSVVPSASQPASRALAVFLLLGVVLLRRRR